MGSGTKSINRMKRCMFLYESPSGQEKWFKFQIGRDIEFFIININRTNLFYMQAFLDRKIGSNFKLEERVETSKQLF